MKTQREKAIELANRAIANPKLLDKLTNDTFIKFVIGVSNHSKPLAHKLMDLKPNIPSECKILFWEAVGILKLEGDMANQFNDNYLEDDYVEDYNPYDGL